MVSLDEVERGQWYDYPHKDGAGEVRVFVNRIGWPRDRAGNRWVRVHFDSPQIGWGAEADISVFCRLASL